MTKKRRRTGSGASETAGRGVRKDWIIKDSASTEALTVHVAFLWFWLQVDVRDATLRSKLWAEVQKRWQAATRGRKSDAPTQFGDDWRARMGELRDAGDGDRLLMELYGCADEATPSRTTTWRPLRLPRSVVGAGGKRG